MLFFKTYTAEARPWHASKEKGQRSREAVKLAEWLETNDVDTMLRLEKALEGRGEEIDQLLGAHLRNDMAAYCSTKRRLWIVLAMATMLMGLAIHYNVLQYGMSTCASYLIMPTWLAVPFLLGWHDDSGACKRRMHNTVKLLARRRSKQAVSPLIEAMTCADTPTRALAATALTTLLPRLEAADARMLSSRHHACLHRALHGYDSNLMLAILQALEKVGEPSALAHVQRLTNCSILVAGSTLIRRQARTCLALLRVRAAKRAVAQSLLRAATADTVSAAMLLRAAPPFGPVKPHQLLRAAPCETSCACEEEDGDSCTPQELAIVANFPEASFSFLLFMRGSDDADTYRVSGH